MNLLLSSLLGCLLAFKTVVEAAPANVEQPVTVWECRQTMQDLIECSPASVSTTSPTTTTITVTETTATTTTTTKATTLTTTTTRVTNASTAVTTETITTATKPAPTVATTNIGVTTTATTTVQSSSSNSTSCFRGKIMEDIDAQPDTENYPANAIYDSHYLGSDSIGEKLVFRDHVISSIVFYIDSAGRLRTRDNRFVTVASFIAGGPSPLYLSSASEVAASAGADTSMPRQLAITCSIDNNGSLLCSTLGRKQAWAVCYEGYPSLAPATGAFEAECYLLHVGTERVTC